MSTPAAGALPMTLGWRRGLGYASLAVPLAFVSLPLYVNLPYHYASVLGMPLAALGAVMLAVRLLDAFIDPALGRAVDALFRRGAAAARWAAGLGSLVLALAFAALWRPPSTAPAVMTAWLVAALLTSTLAYSGVSILHQSWGTRWGGGPALRARVTGWREAGTLTGVLLASALPVWAGWNATSLALALLLAAGLLGLSRLPARARPHLHQQPQPGPSPWRLAAFRQLLAVFMLNGIASAIPATLLPFFIADRLQLPQWQAPLLLGYFAAAVLGLPLWVRMAARWGLAPTWRLGMAASVLAFAATPWLAAGDGAAFAAVCLCSGLALGADLALPGALLTGVIHRNGAGGRDEGVYLGWWTCATKLNLALAAGLALPLLAAAGYRSGGRDEAGLLALAWAYGGLPCLLKLAAAAALWRAEGLNPSWKDHA
ncbi:Na+/melibiose symporter-like transporter [Pelomonas saccharophila]|uniref:Na+/melibiose symporter-like transporter n=1 Tax=Roseateles saccharophilus TaxID=304 RepID=A0ABU1YLJ5_ROSSA|nr:MFS transporter [Roseateles saccharophilus]MDR7269729.1 Na+/melibiose symporter-like transporter [Roseateles saccharophilus]